MSAQRLAASEQFRPLAGQAGRTVHLEELTRDERAVLMSWLGFSSTFALLRAITYSIRKGVGPFHNWAWSPRWVRVWLPFGSHSGCPAGGIEERLTL